jgi:ABC-type cobalamin/Fe3+-siderophores transport system ATPase subunit
MATTKIAITLDEKTLGRLDRLVRAPVPELELVGIPAQGQGAGAHGLQASATPVSRARAQFNRVETLAVVGPSGTGKSVLLKTTIALIVPDRGDVFVDGVSVEVGKGEVIGLLGPNGAGKTTVLRAGIDLKRFNPKKSGDVEIPTSPTLAVRLIGEKSNGKNNTSVLFTGQMEMKSISASFDYQYLKKLKQRLSAVIYIDSVIIGCYVAIALTPQWFQFWLVKTWPLYLISEVLPGAVARLVYLLTLPSFRQM